MSVLPLRPVDTWHMLCSAVVTELTSQSECSQLNSLVALSNLGQLHSLYIAPVQSTMCLPGYRQLWVCVCTWL